MKRSLRICAIITSLSAGLFSCNKYLDVKPEDQFVESAVYASEKGFINHLNGIYLDMGQGALYGGDLTFTLVSILGQEYNISSNSSHNWYQHANYAYANSLVEPAKEEVWSKAYEVIMSTNNLLENMDKFAGVLKPFRDSIIRGEALAIRAYMHFDLLRLYGPVYVSDSLSKSIPYVTHADINTRPLLSANNVMDSILADLDHAERCLKTDPVISGGPMRIHGAEEVDFFYQQRNGRLNYYAVKALKARILLYRGDKTGALAQAGVVIEGAGPWFPWTTLKKASGNADFPDRTFSTEHLFDIYCPKLYQSYSANFSPDVSDRAILAAHPTRLTAAFEGLESDYRYNPSWIIPSVGDKTYRCFYKYADVTNKDSADMFRYRVPMLRLSEMYYIAAECETDPVKALEYLNTIRYNRGLTALPETVTLETEIRKEYQKEFYGEGQLFFYYKRKNQATIPKGGAGSGNFTMTAATYVMPLPRSETDYR
ncbi:RagB/SusD family nutrient uptake outer membrane protein [Chitinophaga filiformis]|uniref:RagB/SusD family nutrient uptake outer membrane protein n=1 Tax=Chitinophaga filiformis TaxID=104663 RepID=UPI001F2A219C|nr:RagB/SusD family nutrient uptake outer membrane protein [Chitinophaga filiformis]MCF6404652.1 RagB/SusD family nutrient uptake outer membrane protein [Chitinophaga filiformis]